LFAVLFALAGPIGGALISLWRFYASPMVFAFDPFVGYFSGTLYDTVIEAGNALLTYRLGSLATIIAFALAASVMTRTARGWAIDIRSPRALLAVLAGAASLATFIFGAK